MECKGFVYILEYIDQTSHLYGLIRYDGKNLNKRTSASDPKYQRKNMICIKGKQENGAEILDMLLKPKNLRDLINFMSNKGTIQGDIVKITNGCETFY